MLDLQKRACPVCLSDKSIVIGKPRKLDKLFSSIPDANVIECQIVQCEKCSLYYVQPFPYFSPELLEKMYSNDNNYFQELSTTFANIIHFVNPERRFNKIEQYAKAPIRKYLEIGCGEGFGLQAAQKKGWQVFGQDVSPDFSNIVKEKTGVDIFVGQLREDSFQSGFFDVIYIDSVLEHIPNPTEYLSLIRHFLAPHGIVYLILPNEGALPNALFDFTYKLLGKKVTSRMMPFAIPYHILGFTKKSINHLAKSVGLNVEFLMCKYSYANIESSKLPFSIRRFSKRKFYGAINKISDALNNGANMEVLLTKTNVEAEAR